ncbi:MAG: hypothetical protein IJY47_04425 [Clostridia bacterium]|nr:hypothetical protein [Clostridia bacterium]
MKKVLSITLTLAMLLGTFLMLVPTASAADDGIYYENNFNNVTGTTAAEILTAIGWTTEQTWADDTQSTVAVQDGRLVINAVTDQEEFVVVSNNNALKEGYIVDFDLEILDNSEGSPADNAFSVHTSLGDFSKRMGRQGWIGQVRYNTNILAGAEAGSGWAPAKNGTPQYAKDTYLKGEGDAVATNMKNIRVAVRIAFDATNKTVKTYVQGYSANNLVWSDDVLAQTATPADAAANLLTENCRFIVYKGLKVAVDNVRIGSADAMSSSRKTYYSNNFDDAALATKTDKDLMTAIGWTGWVDNVYAANTLKIQDGALVVTGQDSGFTTFLVKEDDALLEDYTIEYKFKYLVTDARNDRCAYFLSGAWSDAHNQAGVWHAQPRINGTFLNSTKGDNNSWNETTMPAYSTTTAEGATEKGQLQWFSVRIDVNSETGNKVTLKDAEGNVLLTDTLTEGEMTKAKDTTYAAATWNKYLRFLCYEKVDVIIDDIAVYKDEAVTVKINGEDESLLPATYNLANYTEGDFAFAVINGTEVVKDASYTVTADTVSIDVYSLGVTTLKGAAIRTTDAAALRFQTSIAKAEYDALVAAKTANLIKGFEVGTLSIDYATLGALGQLKLDTAGATKTAATEVLAYGEDNYVFNGVIEVAADKITAKYAAVGYATITFADDSTITVVSAYDRYVHARSVAEIAQTITFDEDHGLTDAQLAVVNTYAAAYVAE